MIGLNNLRNASRVKKNVKRVGRGPGSGRGKTSGRGQKGAGSRSGYRRRFGYEGGQMRLYCKLPHKGFTRGRFIKPHLILNLDDIERHFNNGEIVSLNSLYEKGMASKNILGGLKILGVGELSKKVEIEATAFSKKAIEKLESKKITYRIV